MRVRKFFREEATHTVWTGGNDYDGWTYDAPVTILVRWYTENKLIRDDSGQELTTNARISTISEVKTGDLVAPVGGDAREVKMVRTNRDTRGRFSHYVAWLA